MLEIMLWVIVGLIFILSFHCFKKSFDGYTSNTFCDVMSAPAIFIIILVIVILMIPDVVKMLFEDLKKDLSGKK